MTSNETPAGRLARTMPELGNRELSALACENTRATYTDGTRTALAAVVVRAEDAAGLAGAKYLPLRITSRPSRASRQASLAWSPAYWAALP